MSMSGGTQKYELYSNQLAFLQYKYIYVYTLLALVGDVYCIFVTFPCGILVQVLDLIVSFSDLCRLSYLVFVLSCRVS